MATIKDYAFIEHQYEDVPQLLVARGYEPSGNGNRRSLFQGVAEIVAMKVVNHDCNVEDVA